MTIQKKTFIYNINSKIRNLVLGFILDDPQMLFIMFNTIHAFHLLSISTPLLLVITIYAWAADCIYILNYAIIGLVQWIRTYNLFSKCRTFCFCDTLMIRPTYFLEICTLFCIVSVIVFFSQLYPKWFE